MGRHVGLPSVINLVVLLLWCTAAITQGFTLKQVDPALVSQWPQSFRSCLRTNISSDIPPSKKYKIAIVQSIATDHVQPEFDYATAITRCYCKKYGCMLAQNVIDPKFYKRHHFCARWQSIKERFWDAADWVFGADTDLVPVNFARNFTAFVEQAEQDGASIIFHVRRTDEVAASFVGFKTSDVFVSCFLDYWYSTGQKNPRYNSDNGDLMIALMQILNPAVYKACDKLRDLDYNKFMNCMNRVYNVYNSIERSTSDIQHANTSTSKLNYTAKGAEGWKPPIRIFMPMEGVWRQFLGPGPVDSGFHSMMQSDWFLHGHKQIGRLSITPSLYRCDSTANQLSRIGNASLWYSDRQTFNFAYHCCHWHYPGCVDASGFNICRNATHCQQDVYGLTGAGICNTEQSSTPPGLYSFFAHDTM